MRGRDLIPWLMPLVYGCASTGAPYGWLASPGALAESPFGAWVKVTLEESGADDLSGELIAVNATGLWLLEAYVPAGSEPPAGQLGQQPVRGIPWSDIRCVRVAWYDPKAGPLAVWGFLGAISSVSHGFGALISAPVWIVTSTVATGAHKRQAIVKICEAGQEFPGWRDLAPYAFPRWRELAPYARFPQGPVPEMGSLTPRGRLSRDPMQGRLRP